MKSKAIRILAIGKIKCAYWKEACAHYIKLISRWQNIECVDLRDANPALSVEKKREQEGERIREQLKAGDYIIALDENGQKPTSGEFACLLEKLDVEAGRVNFVIGGPFGIETSILRDSSLLLSLSAMTWPHELARTMLLEQIFRANCIRHNFPYHH